MGSMTTFRPRLHRAVCHAVGQPFQGFLALGAVVLGIQRHARIVVLAMVDVEAGQILQRVQRLSAASDQDSQCVAVNVDLYVALIIRTGFDGPLPCSSVW